MSTTQTSFVSPHRFYQLVDIYQKLDPKLQIDLDEAGDELAQLRVQIEESCDEVEDIYRRFMRESEQGTRQRLQSQWATSEEQRDARDPFRTTLSGANFLAVVRSITKAIKGSYQNLQTLMESLRPAPLMLSGERPDLKDPKSFGSERMQRMAYEIQVNGDSVVRFASAIMTLRDGRAQILKSLESVIMALEGYYQDLVVRHTRDGIEIFDDPLRTDVALCIYENVDSHGEIAAGTDPDKVSAYSIHKASVLASATRSGLVGMFLQHSDKFLEFIRKEYRSLWNFFTELESTFSGVIEKVFRTVNPYVIERPVLPEALEDLLVHLEAVDPRNVTYRDPGNLRTSEERHEHQFHCETLKRLVDMLGGTSTTTTEMVQYILQRKAQLHKWRQEENSFYVCRIGSGNQFRGIAPGALEVIPGTRPTVNMGEIIGSGFDDIRDFIEQVESSAKWHDLFVATSPSRSADKSNVLLIGPQGCGKCVTGDTLVFTSQGLCRIEDLHPGEVDADGYASLETRVRSLGDHASSSSHFYYSGVQPTFKVETKHGYRIEGTDKHRVIVATDEGPVWKRLDEIEEGDLVGIIRSPDSGVVSDLVGPDSFHGEWFPMGSGDVGAEDAYLLGMGGVVSECGSGAAHKRVPKSVLCAGKGAWRGFLSGLFDADGSAYQSRVELGSNSETLIRTVQTMLTAFGIVSSITSRVRHEPSMGMKEYVSWRLFIYGEDARRFYYRVGFRMTRKMAELEPLLSKERNDNWDCIPVSRELWQALKEQAGKLPRATHKALDHYVRGHYPSRRKLSELLSLVGITEGASFEAISRMADPKWFWDRVQVSGATGEDKPVYDLVVPGEQSFAANGFMNHNTEVLRGVGGDKRSLSIFAQGSDFNTCWLGEASKNPKRLFQEGLKLHKESGKHVHFLIDEIDAVLNNDRHNSGYINLTLEFQILMDGVVQYPHLSVWGTTNNPHRIPMPMIRRFSKVAVVGELDQNDRIVLLKHFAGFLPCQGFSEELWKDLAIKLEGATGDVIRKVVDTVWREVMTEFVTDRPTDAKTMLAWLNNGSKFEVGEFDGYRRKAFQKKLGEYVQLSPERLARSVESSLDNVAVIHEIETAKMVYENAKVFLASVTEERAA